MICILLGTVLRGLSFRGLRCVVLCLDHDRLAWAGMSECPLKSSSIREFISIRALVPLSCPSRLRPRRLNVKILRFCWK